MSLAGEAARQMADSIVVVPTYNEAGNIEALLDRVLALKPDFDILVVDDNSSDGTAQLVQAMAQTPDRLGRIRLLSRPGKLGLGTAYSHAFRELLAGSGYQFIFQMDADFSHTPEDLLRLRDSLDRSDVAIGSRYQGHQGVERWSLARQALSQFGNLYLRLALGTLPANDMTSGFKGFRRRTLEGIDLANLSSKGYAFQVEMNYLSHKAGFSIAEVPIVFTGRHAGESKMSMAIILEAFLLPWTLRR